MKIRFYHMWIYRLYFHFWTPILKERPHMVKAMVEYMNSWLEREKK